MLGSADLTATADTLAATHKAALTENAKAYVSGVSDALDAVRNGYDSFGSESYGESEQLAGVSRTSWPFLRLSRPGVSVWYSNPAVRFIVLVAFNDASTFADRALGADADRLIEFVGYIHAPRAFTVLADVPVLVLRHRDVSQLVVRATVSEQAVEDPHVCLLARPAQGRVRSIQSSIVSRSCDHQTVSPRS